MSVVIVHFVGGADGGKYTHSEISASNIPKYTDSLEQNLDSKQNEPPRQATDSSSDSSEHHSARSDEGGHHHNLHIEEKQESASVDVTEDTKLKGDPTNDDVSWKQWKEQRLKMDLHKESFHKPASTSSEGIAEETASDSDHPSPDSRADEFISDDDRSKSLRDTESIQRFRSPHEEVVTGLSAESEDILNNLLGSIDGDLDVNEEQSNSTEENSNAGDSSNEEHDGNEAHSEEADRPESPAVETTAIPDHVDREYFQNVRDENLLKTEDSVNFPSAETANNDVENENSGGISVSEEPTGEETFQEDSDRGRVEEPPELVESLHRDRDEFDDDEDDDEMQGEWESEADSLEEDTAAVDAGEHEAADIESDEIFDGEEHPDTDIASLNEKQAHTADEDIAPVQVDVLDGDSADVVLDESSPGWTQSTLNAVYSFIDAVVDMVRHRISFVYDHPCSFA